MPMHLQTGPVEGLCPKRMETNPFSLSDVNLLPFRTSVQHVCAAVPMIRFCLMGAGRGKDDFDMTWAERLWSRPYKGYGVMDMVLLGASAEK